MSLKEAEGSDSQLLTESMQKIGIALLTSFVLIYMLLVILYRSYLAPLIIMFTVPLAFIGISFSADGVNFSTTSSRTCGTSRARR